MSLDNGFGEIRCEVAGPRRCRCVRLCLVGLVLVFGFAGFVVCYGWCVVVVGFVLWPRCVQMSSKITQQSNSYPSEINPESMRI